MKKGLFYRGVLAALIIWTAACDTGDNLRTPEQSDGDGNSGSDADGDDDGDGGADGDGDGNSQRGCDKMDILFVIDDSGSMECEQQMLAQSFPGFIEVLENYNNAKADQISYRVGVTSTGKTATLRQKTGIFPVDQPMQGMDGRLKEINNLPNPWIDGPGNQNQITAQFSQMAQLGTSGPGYEMPLLALRMALEKDTTNGPNAGFIREDALFIAVVISDEDDCSRLDDPIILEINETDNCTTPTLHPNLVDLAEFKDYLDGRFGGPTQYVIVSIAGQYDCSDGSSYPVQCGAADQYAGALDAKRLKSFISDNINGGSTQNGLFSDICTTDMPSALELALEKMEVACDEFGPVL